MSCRIVSQCQDAGLVICCVGSTSKERLVQHPLYPNVGQVISSYVFATASTPPPPLFTCGYRIMLKYPETVQASFFILQHSPSFLIHHRLRWGIRPWARQSVSSIRKTKACAVNGTRATWYSSCLSKVEHSVMPCCFIFALLFRLSRFWCFLTV